MSDVFSVADSVTLLVVHAAANQDDWFCSKYRMGCTCLPVDAVIADLTQYAQETDSAFVDTMLQYLVTAYHTNQTTLATLARYGFCGCA